MKVAILGSGNGALAMGFEWARAGHDIYMFDFPSSTARSRQSTLQAAFTARAK